MRLILIWIVVFFAIGIFFVCVVLRAIRRIYPFPIPGFMTRLIDNPVRRRFIQNPAVIAHRMKLAPGMIVVEIGPGKGTYTKAIAEKVLPDGKVYAIDIQEYIIDRLQQMVAKEGLTNIIPKIDNAHNFSFADESIDRVIAIASLPEIPEPIMVLREVKRILKPDGLLSLSELAIDPDYPLRRTVRQWATEAGFTIECEYGNWFTYQLNFRKRLS